MVILNVGAPAGIHGRTFAVSSWQILRYYHRDALELYNSTSDLRLLCCNPDLMDPTKRIKSSIQVSDGLELVGRRAVLTASTGVVYGVACL